MSTYMSLFIFVYLNICVLVSDRDFRLSPIFVTGRSPLPLRIRGLKPKIYGKRLFSLVQRISLPTKNPTLYPLSSPSRKLLSPFNHDFSLYVFLLCRGLLNSLCYLFLSLLSIGFFILLIGI